jgi:hypothetical protein
MCIFFPSSSFLATIGTVSVYAKPIPSEGKKVAVKGDRRYAPLADAKILVPFCTVKSRGTV